MPYVSTSHEEISISFICFLNRVLFLLFKHYFSSVIAVRAFSKIRKGNCKCRPKHICHVISIYIYLVPFQMTHTEIFFPTDFKKCTHYVLMLGHDKTILNRTTFIFPRENILKTNLSPWQGLLIPLTVSEVQSCC